MATWCDVVNLALEAISPCYQVLDVQLALFTPTSCRSNTRYYFTAITLTMMHFLFGATGRDRTARTECTNLHCGPRRFKSTDQRHTWQLGKPGQVGGSLRSRAINTCRMALPAALENHREDLNPFAGLILCVHLCVKGVIVG